MRILVTGSSGFLGSNLVPYLQQFPLDIVGLDKDPPTVGTEHFQYALGSFSGDLSPVLEGVECVIHLASQSHVDRSITGPRQFLTDNIDGTLELYEACRNFPEIKSIIQFSTDEVGACLETSELTEEYRFHTGSVYSASKAAQELLAQAYVKTFSLPIITTRCVNIFGPEQADEKLIPTICRKALADEQIPVYGSGMQQRQWVFVNHVCEFLHYVATSNFIPPAALLHITGTKEIYNIMMVNSILSLLGKPSTLISHVEDRLGHDTRYALGRTDETDRYGCPVYDQSQFMADLQQTVEWYKEKHGK